MQPHGASVRTIGEEFGITSGGSFGFALNGTAAYLFLTYQDRFNNNINMKVINSKMEEP